MVIGLSDIHYVPNQLFFISVRGEVGRAMRASAEVLLLVLLKDRPL